MISATERTCAACAQPLPTSARESRTICIECENRAILANADAVDDLLGDAALQTPLDPVDGLAFDAALRDLRASGVLRPPNDIDSSRCNRPRNAQSPVPHLNTHDETKPRLCVVCEASLAALRSDATTCSPKCRKIRFRSNRLAGKCSVNGCEELSKSIVDRKERGYCDRHDAQRLFEKLLRRRYKRAIKAAPPDLAPYAGFVYDEWLADLGKASGAFRFALKRQQAITAKLDAYAWLMCFAKLDLEYTVTNVDAHSSDAVDEWNLTLDDEKTADPSEPVVRKRRMRGRSWHWHDSQ